VRLYFKAIGTGLLPVSGAREARRFGPLRGFSRERGRLYFKAMSTGLLTVAGAREARRFGPLRGSRERGHSRPQYNGGLHFAALFPISFQRTYPDHLRSAVCFGRLIFLLYN